MKTSPALKCLGLCALGVIMFCVGISAFQEYGASAFQDFVLLVGCYGGMACLGVGVIAGLIFSCIAFVRNPWRQRVAPTLLVATHALIAVAVLYVVSNPFRHWVKLSAARAGMSSYYAEVGWNYIHGTGCPKDPDMGIYWLNAAAEAGDDDTMLELARMYDSQFSSEMKGIEYDPSIARKYRAWAEESGNYTALTERSAEEYRIKNTDWSK